ncbi:MAG: 3-hydroxyacyl-CoA dehydrogenase/enoyl-CoA hydratase family protein [Bacteroidota bacterium]|jgi:3-hydroxyacyl-CoA dehydrogenase
MNRKIKNVAILGSGVMGSRIACHFANIGVSVLLLDITPKELTEDEKKKNLTTDHKAVKNRIVNTSLQNTIQSKPAALYHKDAIKLITTGNFTDDLDKIKDCDWIIEVVVEQLEIKKQLLEKVDSLRKPGTLITSNTSSIPIHLMSEGRSDDFRKHFCGTHFFNPPRYLRLLEIIPTPETDQEVIDFLMHYGDLYLGKTTVLCKDTPAFIANRIGVYAIMRIFHLMQELELTVDEVDKLTGPAIGRPKSATFRTADVVGIDTLVKVAHFVYGACPNDEARELFKIPPFVQKLVDHNWIGDKTKQGFFKVVKNAEGKKEFWAIDPKTSEYVLNPKPKFPILESLKQSDDLRTKMSLAVKGNDKGALFYRKLFFGLFQYISKRVPEIADELYRIDDALVAGFGWELGPFATWDAMGVKETTDAMIAMGLEPAPWILEFIKSGKSSFYHTEMGRKKCYNPASKTYETIPGSDTFIILENYASQVVWKNSGTQLLDIGDGVLNLEFKTKMNSIGGEVLEGVQKSIAIAEKDFCGLVIGNDAANFSAGANLAMMLMLAIEQEYDELDMAARMFQNTSMRIRYSSVPVVVAPHGLTLGGSCEFTLHADKVLASAETYIGLVEFGVGIIPAGGGTKEMTLRASDAYQDGAIEFFELQKRLLTIAMAKVATSAHEAFELGILKAGRDEVVMNPSRVIAEAKRSVIELSHSGYTQPAPRHDIRVLGRSALGAFLSGMNGMLQGRYISEHDRLISEKLAYVMCGGDLSTDTRVSEQYLLDLEREAFLSLVTTKKSMERIQSILTTGKPLRN